VTIIADSASPKRVLAWIALRPAEFLRSTGP